mgnify:CR=1 FL=1
MQYHHEGTHKTFESGARRLRRELRRLGLIEGKNVHSWAMYATGDYPRFYAAHLRLWEDKNGNVEVPFDEAITAIEKMKHKDQFYTQMSKWQKAEGST